MKTVFAILFFLVAVVGARAVQLRSSKQAEPPACQNCRPDGPPAWLKPVKGEQTPYDKWVDAQLAQIPVSFQPAVTVGLNNAKLEGLMLEFGVFSATTINYMAQERSDQTFYGFDSFVGLPEHWDRGYEGGANNEFTFNMKGNLPVVLSNVKLVKGWFNETLPGFLAAHPGPVSLVHLDADLYSSTKTCFDNLSPRIVPGTVIVFDELIGYPDFKEHEMKALYEFVNAHGVKFNWLGTSCPLHNYERVSADQKCGPVALKITSVAGAAH